ncbi:MAG TPA: lipoyl synthase [Acidimicrobiales bacterium]|nr:lipoyl synthase [Acidimicrobiales bacterium]
MTPLRVRWLGRVRYRDAHALQHSLHAGSADHLLLLEHPHVVTLGVRAKPENLLITSQQAHELGCEILETDRGGDVTYHGPGQLVGYPVMNVVEKPGAMADTRAWVTAVEQLLIDSLTDLGLEKVGRDPEYPGVWVDPDGPAPRKIAAIGVRLTRGRSMHGFALNVDPDMSWFSRIVPCGISDRPVTSVRAEGITVSMADVVEAVTRRAAERWGDADFAAVDASPPPGTSANRSVSVELKPSWLRPKAVMGDDYRSLRKRMRSLDLVTVCEEAGCPNIYECWAEGTATFMLNGERCTRACGFCLVDTSKPMPPDPLEPERVATAVADMGLSHAVVTAVARDDLPDGGASGFAATVEAVRRRSPGTAVELLIPDCKGDPDALETVFASRPDVLNHNLETVLRLQRSVRPQASYARSLSVLGRAKAAGLVTKSGLIVGMGETDDEVIGALADLRAVGVDIVTIGQYLRPSASHLPVARWWTPAEIDAVADAGRAMGFAHVEASPLTRSSYHARTSLEAAAATPAAQFGT